MNPRSTVRAVFALPLILLAFSCASTPPEPTPEPEKPPVAAPETPPAPEKPVVPAPDDAKAAAEKARAEAALFDAEAAFPEDWKAAEASFAAGDKAYNVDNEASRASYEAAAKAFADLAVKAKPLFLEKIAAAKARAETGRKQAFDLEAKSVLPDDWKAAESFYFTGRDEFSAGEKGEDSSYPKSLSAYTSAADAFEALVKKALPLFADARGKELLKAREDAQAAGADKLDPARFAVADDAARKVVAAYEKGGDYYGAYASWQTARDRYFALATGARAASVKAEIDKRSLAAYDSGNYARAGERMDAAVAAFDKGEASVARDAAEEAHLRYKLALAKGSELYASDRGKAAEAQRVAAWELKAHVAVKADYDAAAKEKADADAAFKAKKFDDAADLYADAESKFAVVTEVAAEKRKAAEAAIKAAEERMRASEKTAQEADALIEGGAR